MRSRESLASRAQAMPAKRLKRQKGIKILFANFFIVNSKEINVTKDTEQKIPEKCRYLKEKRPARLNEHLHVSSERNLPVAIFHETPRAPQPNPQSSLTPKTHK